MIEVTWKELQHDKNLDKRIDSTYQWYIFRDKAVILYIGTSENVLHRAYYHRKMSTICLWHEPHSWEWQVQFLTLEDIFQFVPHSFSQDEKNQSSRMFREKVERALTLELCPCFDRRISPGRIIPPHYQVPWYLHPGVSEADRITTDPEEVMEFFRGKQKVPKLIITIRYLEEEYDICSLDYGPSLYYGEPGYSATCRYKGVGLLHSRSLPSNQEFKLFSYRAE